MGQCISFRLSQRLTTIVPDNHKKSARFSSEKNVTNEDYSVRMKTLMNSYQKPISSKASSSARISVQMITRERRGSYVPKTSDGSSSARFSSRRMSRVLAIQSTPSSSLQK